jgi:hypothetical protein
LKPTVEAELEALRRESFSYFEHEVNRASGLVRDETAQDWPASFTLSTICALVFGFKRVVLRGYELHLAAACDPKILGNYGRHCRRRARAQSL